ncbi:MAG: mannonate dehydratase, partial [Emcibacter sp.]|nr:mannonate dehydratase [Emcibacter sp.]
MYEAWRWFGPDDSVTLDHIRQADATDVVTALHHIPIGDVWPLEEITARQNLIEHYIAGRASLKWSVVESVPVHDDIKRGADGCDRYIANFVSTLRNLAEAGIQVVCYNFMPVIDWTRTDLKFSLSSGALALRFDQDVFAAFDLFILKREDATQDYDDAEYKRALDIFESMTEADIARLVKTIVSGLPGKMTDDYSLGDFRAALSSYKAVTREDLRANLLKFLDA